MSLGILLANLGSVCLGITLAVVFLFMLASRQSTTDQTEGCLGLFVCGIGITLAALFYSAAINVWG